MALKQLMIKAFKDDTFGSEIGSYTAMLNPESYTQSYNISYNEEQAPGTPEATLKYEKSTPTTLKFDLIFDATGVVNTSVTDVGSEIQKFRKVVYDYNGNIHSPNYLEVTWGNALVYQCKLTGMTVNYTLFKSDGTPLRAKVTVDFKEYVAPTKPIKDNSPDMTHVKTVVSGDLLPSLTYNVYGDETHLLKVAEHNKLDSILHLKSGSTLYFPPLASQ
ncbi:LysM peptidoglycan-binding domain-containing protein [Roseivirga sp. UBA838]|uniref:CIS tube protein n=1 Tax=Roseivirga sp. UBA838 TaxID=1947393 RepID=UPI0025796866|nr:LysM peptidoglycan-binding domain-containing protein [Roseivirga sp. UBA838]|tara:strand:+ start:8370 stop:9023 length:654 start_codon:yes stop_codon:yes gene_type:complete